MSYLNSNLGYRTESMSTEKNIFKSKVFFIGYTLLVILISSLITTAYFHYFVINQDKQETLFSVSSSEVENSPIKDDKTIIEIFSYGCHYCAINEENVTQLENRMPEGTRFIRLHISSDKTTGLGRLRLFLPPYR